MAESQFQLGGAPPTKQFKEVPITTSLFFSGLYTQRSPFGSPDSRYINRVIGGRTDILIDGLNMELTNYGTLIRRPGSSPFSTANIVTGALAFYSFHPFNATISLIADTATQVWTLLPTSATSIFTKSSNAGQTYFQGVGNILYMGNGVDQKAYPFGGTTRNWGIALGGSSTGPNIAGNGVNSGGGGSHPNWTNPNNVTSAVSYATNSLSLIQSTTAALNTTQFGFGIGAVPIAGIQVTIDIDPANAGILTLQLLKAGNPVGSSKQVNSSGNGIVSGGSSDLWGTTWSSNDINQTTFGVAITGFNPNAGFPGSGGPYSVRNVNITVFSTSTAPAVTTTAGSLSPTTGFQYIYSYSNSSSGQVSNPTGPSVLIKPVNQGVQVTLTASTDTQVTGIRVFRTKDGGSTFFELPTSPFPNSSGNITDNNTDSTLQLLNFFPSTNPWLFNSPPPAGLVKLSYHLNRVWGVVNNNVYFSALLGDELPSLGVGPESWPPANVFVFPHAVNRLLPIASGLLVFTTDDIWIITGTSRTGSTGAILTSQIFQQGVGLLSYNALDVEGNQIFLYTSDKQFISFSAAGPVEIGYPIGVDIQNTVDPTKAYVASLVSGTQDKAVFLSDGSSIWYRCNWNQPPEGGPAWSPKASISGGIVSIASVETSPGVHQLLIGQSNGTVQARSYSVFSDNGVAYTAFATIGSLVLAKPGQLAGLSSIVLELQNVGTTPSVSIMLDEISGNNFELLAASVNDPPRLAPSNTILSRRWYLSQGGNPSWCRHVQVKISFIAEIAKNELLTKTLMGSLANQE